MLLRKIEVRTLFLWLLLPLVAGILWQHVEPYPYAVVVFAMVALIVLQFLILKTKNSFQLSLVILGGLFFFVGAAVLQMQRDQRYFQINNWANKNLTVVGRIKDIQQQILGKSRCVVTLHVNCIKTCDERQIDQAEDFILQIYIGYKHVQPLLVGDVVECANIKIKPTKSVSLAGNASYDDYLCKEGVLASVFCYGDFEFKIRNRPSFSLSRWWWAKRAETYNKLRWQLSPRTFAYFSLIFLGNKTPQQSDQLRQIFNYWGVAYYLARSGIHIVFFIMIWHFLLGLIPLHINLRRLILLLICVIYSFLSWSSIPFARAFYMFLLMEVGRIFDQQINFMYLLSVTCITILLFNPTQLFFLDFQLTFLLTFALSWISQLIAHDKKEKRVLNT